MVLTLLPRSIYATKSKNMGQALLRLLLTILQGSGDQPPEEYRIQITFDDKDRDPDRLGLIL